MAIKFKLKNWEDQLVDFTLERTDDIKDIILVVLCSDEVLIVTYKDGSQIKYDSCETRSLGLFDDARTITLEELQHLH